MNGEKRPDLKVIEQAAAKKRLKKQCKAIQIQF